jgi:hypothetical protein
MRHREAGKIAQRHAGAVNSLPLALLACLLIFATDIAGQASEGSISIAASGVPDIVDKCAGKPEGCAWCSFLLLGSPMLMPFHDYLW